MRILGFLIITSFLSSCATQSITPREGVEVQYYLSTLDYFKDQPSRTVYGKIELKKPDYMKLTGFFDKQSYKRIKKANTAWAVKYKNEVYYNMKYSKHYELTNIYAKHHVQGKISALILNDETSKKLTVRKQNHAAWTLGGIAAALLMDPKTRGINWTDSDGKEAKIIVVNSERRISKHKNGYYNAIGELLSRNNFNILLGTRYDQMEIDKMMLEEAIEVIKKVNSNK